MLNYQIVRKNTPSRAGGGSIVNKAEYQNGQNNDTAALGLDSALAAKYLSMRQ